MVIWKGINLENKGIIVEKTPQISKGKKRIDTYEIAGRSGFLTIDNGTYDAFVVSCECHFDNDRSNWNDIKEFLDGYGTLSFDGLKEYTAIIQNAISFEKIKNFKKFMIQFLVNPIAEDINSTSVSVDSDEYTLNISDATANMYPVIEITATEQETLGITVNNKTFYLYDIDGKYILDCKEKVITHNGTNASNHMKYDFPFLISGENSIEYTGTIDEFKITYKKAYL